MRQSGEPWDVCKKSYAVRKVVVSEGWPRKKTMAFLATL
jgi:hypothetical protein